MDNKPIIEISDVSMRFNLATEKHDTIKEYIVKLIKHQLMFNEFYALRNVSLTIDRGDSVALIGVNGSGKSTLLKCIAGVMSPTQGSIIVRGSIAPLIELGAGFDMDLTARENIYLNGAVLGHDRAFMDEHFDSIVDFAELWEFIDVPVKNFSSGMVARLGFAIATEVKADILVVDEVLSVGDGAFRKKSEAKMREIIHGGAATILVSHSLAQVREMCSKVLWLHRGRQIDFGDTAPICDRYQAYLEGELTL